MTGIFNKSEPLETYPSNHWDETGCIVDSCNSFQIQVKPPLLCHVVRARARASVLAMARVS